MKRVAKTTKTVKKVATKAAVVSRKRTSTTRTKARAPRIVIARAPRAVLSHATPVVEYRASRVRSSLIARVAATVLISYFLIVPVADVYADTTPAPTPDAAVAAPAADVPPVVDPTPAPEVVPAPTTTDVPAVVADAAPVATTAPETPSTTPAVVDPTPAPVATSSDPTPSSTSTEVTTPAATTTTPAPVIAPAATTTPVVATTAPAVVPPAPVATDPANGPLVVSHRTDADQMSFAVGECIVVGNGTFQCAHATASTSASGRADGVYAARDAVGVMQIYYQHNGTTDTITSTPYDNEAPAFDTANGDIVWHALLDDRYQIMRYDHKNGVTTKLTTGHENSMLPSSYDGVVVYQTWGGNDWDIVMLDRDGTPHLLTNNDEHDVAPSINDRYITWQSRENTEWVAKVYDRSTATTQTVHGTPGSKVENPRMVLVFDSKKENGDIETVGYDVARNQVVPLSATPAPLPSDIPQPAHQKNDQAFVQATTTLKIEVKSATGTPDGTGGTGTSTPPDSAATSTAPILTDATATPTTGGDTLASSTIAVPTLDASSTTALPTIPDLVIQPYATDTASTTNVQ